ncbi:hypothetical protein DLM76_11285 [Leptospira yasudae]|nr:hypothetical protein DLM76_11285 [Leptospira yasudae]
MLFVSERARKKKRDLIGVFWKGNFGRIRSGNGPPFGRIFSWAGNWPEFRPNFSEYGNPAVFSVQSLIGSKSKTSASN